MFNFGLMNYIRLPYFFIPPLLLLALTDTNAQTAPGWSTLADVTYVSRRDSLLGYEIESPVFGKKVTALEGKNVELKGYIVPLEEMRGHRYFVLSALPYNICFFCGAAGPETVAEVYLTEDVAYTEKAITIRGVLELNASDPLHLMYIIKDAELVNIKQK